MNKWFTPLCLPTPLLLCPLLENLKYAVTHAYTLLLALPPSPTLSHPPTLPPQSLYGLLMLLPQSQAYKTLSDRLVTVSSLQMHVGFAGNPGYTTTVSRRG